MCCRTATKLNLTQCRSIIDNGYRTKDGQHDYEQEELDARYLELVARFDERCHLETQRMLEVVALMEIMGELPPPIPDECLEDYVPF